MMIANGLLVALYEPAMLKRPRACNTSVYHHGGGFPSSLLQALVLAADTAKRLP